MNRMWLLSALLLTLLLPGCELETPSGKGSLSIRSNPDRAEIFINGKPQGTTPATIPGLPAADYTVELRKEGYGHTYNSVSLLEGQEETLAIQMNRVTGLLLVESNPAGADVLIDGIAKGTTPLLLTDLPLGSYKLDFQAPNQLPRTMETELVDRTPVRVFAELVSNTALLDASSSPSGAEVHVNGVLVGKTPLRKAEVPAGKATVKISRKGYTPYRTRMEFEAAKPYQVDAELEALPSGLTVISQPPGAKITIDNKAVGEAPLTLTNLKEGPHEIVASLNGYATKTKTIYLEPDINDSVEFSMEKNSGTLVIDTEPANVQIYLGGKLLTTTQSKGGSDSISQPVRITLRAGLNHNIQLVREGFVPQTVEVKTEIDQIVTRHAVLNRIFVYDTQITTDSEIIKCRMEYKLPNGDIYYERYPGVFDTAKAGDIRSVQPVTLDDESNREARRLIEQSKQTAQPK